MPPSRMRQTHARTRCGKARRCEAGRGGARRGRPAAGSDRHRRPTSIPGTRCSRAPTRSATSTRSCSARRPGIPGATATTPISEVELMLPDPKDAKKRQAHTESLRIRAQLDDTYAPINMERADNRDETQIQTSVLAEETQEDRRHPGFGGPQEPPGERGRGSPLLPLPDVHLPAPERQAGQARHAAAMLFTPREDDKLPLSEVQIEVHEIVKKEYMGKKDVPVTRVTYLKPPPAPNRDAELLETFVDKFGRIVEETTRGGVRRVLVKDEVEAAGTKERVRPGARRDPFRKDLAMMYSSKAGAGIDIVREPPPDPTNMAATFAKMEALIQELRKAKEEKRDEEGQKAYEKFLDIQSAVKSLNNLGKPLPPEQMARVESLRKQAEDVWGGVDRLMKQLQADLHPGDRRR